MIIGTNYTHGGDIYRNRVQLDFSVNVNPLGTPEPVKEAVIAAAENLAAYPDPYCGELREKLADFHRTDPAWILCGNGAAELIYQFVSALKPKHALLPVPSFSDYEAALRAADCDPVFYPLLRTEGFLLSEKILPAITEETELLMLASPNNPTGRLIDRELLLKILDRCRETGTWLFLDECFGELTDNGTPSLIGELKDGDRVFLLRAFTKTYAMAGLRLGCALCPNREILEQISQKSQPWNVSSVAQAAGIAALSCRDFAEQARKVIREEKNWMVRELRRLSVSVLPGDANYLLLSGVPGLYERLLQRGILVRNCENYRGLGRGDCRIAVRTREDNEVLIETIGEVLHA